MALVSKSVQITGLDATPVTKLNTSYFNGRIRSMVGYIAAANLTGATAGQWYTFCRMPARARLISVDVTNLTSTTGAVSVGLYRTTANGGAEVSKADIMAVLATTANNRAAGDTALTALQRSQIATDAFATEIGTASATADVEFDVALTIVTVIGTPVDITVEVKYVDND